MSRGWSGGGVGNNGGKIFLFLSFGRGAFLWLLKIWGSRTVILFVPFFLYTNCITFSQWPFIKGFCIYINVFLLQQIFSAGIPSINLFPPLKTNMKKSFKIFFEKSFFFPLSFVDLLNFSKINPAGALT